MADFKTLITKMTQAACAGVGQATAACFTASGVYHDVFYGAFEGAAISNMIENYFHRNEAQALRSRREAAHKVVR